MTGDGRPMLFW